MEDPIQLSYPLQRTKQKKKRKKDEIGSDLLISSIFVSILARDNGDGISLLSFPFPCSFFPIQVLLACWDKGVKSMKKTSAD